MIHGSFRLEEGAAASAIREHFGADCLDIFISIDRREKSYACHISLPEGGNDIFKYDNLAIEVMFGKSGPLFIMSGELKFSFLNNAVFRVQSSFSKTSFLISAAMSSKEPVKLTGDWYVDDTTLVVGFSKGLIFGLFTGLIIRDLSVNGGILMSQSGGLMHISLISAGINRLSLPFLFDNLTGRHIPGIEHLDIISINGFKDIKTKKPFDTRALDAGDHKYIAGHFNAEINSPSFRMNPDELKIRKTKDSYAVTDTSRMLHYSIDRGGEISLMAQFYFSDIVGGVTIGSYRLSAGIFVCASISIFGHSFSALFSFRPDEGVVAFARLDKIDLGFLQISSSGITADLLPLPANSLAKQLIPEKNDGLVFYLSASKQDISFYLDGSISLLGLASVKMRLLCMGKRVSLYAAYSIFGLKTSVKIDANYNDFQRGGFTFEFALDTQDLSAKLTAVKQRIEKTINTLHEKMQNAKNSLRYADQTVNNLQSEITSYQIRINQCITAINSSSAWSRLLVSIAKGAEIALYEIAIAGIYAAMGVAKAALRIAEIAVTFVENLGAEVLALVNNVITAATSLFFLNRAELHMHADAQDQSFRAMINFRALGEDYSLEASFSLSALKDGAAALLSGSMISKLQNQLTNLENGIIPHTSKRLSGKLPSFEENRAKITNAVSEIQKAGRVMTEMRAGYHEEFGCDHSEFQSLLGSFGKTLSDAGYSLNTADQLSDMQSLQAAVYRLSETPDIKDEDRALIISAQNEFDDLSELHNLSRQAFDASVKVEQELAEAADAADKISSRKRSAAPSKDMGRFLQRLENTLHENYGESDTGYINLAVENRISSLFDEAMEYFDQPSSVRRRKRSKTVSGYVHRL
jgi:hypothetical protein